MPKTTEDEGGELGDRTRSYTNAMTDTAPFPAIQKRAQNSLSFAAHPELQELDTDGDGTIDEADLLKLLKLKHHEENIIREQRYGLLFLSVVILGVGKYPYTTRATDTIDDPPRNPFMCGSAV